MHTHRERLRDLAPAEHLDALRRRRHETPLAQQIERDDRARLETLADRFEANVEVTPELLRERGLVQSDVRVKVLARGEIDKALTVRAHKFSGKAAEKIAAAGGKAEVLG